jgi:predicted anti-sigma-YlaC factor YlaD
MLTCRDITELVTDYVEGRMALWTRVRFRMHLGMCKHCRAYLRQVRTTVAVTGAMPTEPMPPEVRDELMARFRDWQQATPAAAAPSDPTGSAPPAAGAPTRS